MGNQPSQPDIPQLVQLVIWLFPLVPADNKCVYGRNLDCITYTSQTGYIEYTKEGASFWFTFRPLGMQLNDFSDFLIRIAQLPLADQIHELLIYSFYGRDNRDGLPDLLANYVNYYLQHMLNHIDTEHRIRMCDAILKVCAKMRSKPGEPPSDERGGVLAPLNGPPPDPDEIMSNP